MPIQLEGTLSVTVALEGVIDGYLEGEPPEPVDGPRLDFSDADNSFYLGAV